jgi:predicted nuclease of predicted toxin-antitoxin system
MKLFPTLLLALSFSIGFGQSNLKLHVENIPTQNSKKVFLEAFDKDQWQILSTSDIDVTGSVAIAFTPPHIGQFRLRFTGTAKSWTDQLLMSVQASLIVS